MAKSAPVKAYIATGDYATKRIRTVYIEQGKLHVDPGLEPSVAYRQVAPNRLLRRDLKIALQSGFAAALCFGLPTGFYFWLIVIQKWPPAGSMDRLINFFSRYFVPPDLLEMLGAFGWETHDRRAPS